MSLPPTSNSPIFNSSLFIGANDYLSLANADKRYQKMNGAAFFSSLSISGTIDCSGGNVNIASHNGSTQGLKLGGVLVTASAADLNSVAGTGAYLSGITPGVASSNKALVLDSSLNIGGINNISVASISNQGNLLTGDLSGTGGFLRVVNSSSVCYLQAGTSSASGSSADLFIGNISQPYNVSSRRIMFKSDGKAGINTYAPQKQLSVNGDIRICASTDGSDVDYIDLQYVSGQGLKINIKDSLKQSLMIQQSGATANLATASLDLGTAYASRALALTATNGGISGSENYGFGTTSSQVMNLYTYGGFQFVTGSTTNTLGVVKATISSSGAMALSSKLVIGDNSWVGCGSSPNIINLTSGGTCLIGTNTISNNYNYLEVAAGSGGTYSAYFHGRVGVGTPTPSTPLDVRGYSNQTTLNSFGYLSSGGAGDATGFSNRKFSIQSEWGILVVGGEVDVLSDLRLKKNIKDVDDDMVNRFMSCKPIAFQYKNQSEDDLKVHLGYSAQELVEQLIPELVGWTFSDEPMEGQDISCVDGSIIKVGSDQRLTLCLQQAIPLLHRALQKQQELIERNIKEIEKLKVKNKRSNISDVTT